MFLPRPFSNTHVCGSIYPPVTQHKQDSETKLGNPCYPIWHPNRPFSMGWLPAVQSNPLPHWHLFNTANQHEIWLTRPDHRCWCSDHWQSSCPYLAPIPPWHVVQQALLTTTDFSTINTAGIVSLHACILSKELCQRPSPSVSTIRRKTSTPSKDKCN